MEIVEVLLDEVNDLIFNVVLEGSISGTVKTRLLIETDNMDLSFSGKSIGSGNIQVKIPPTGHIIQEGEYNAQLEVLAEDRVFIPLKFKLGFERNIKVSEAKIVSERKINRPKVTATLSRKQKIRRDLRQSLGLK